MSTTVRAAQDLERGDVFQWNGKNMRVVTDAYLSSGDERITNVIVAGRGLSNRTEQFCFRVGTTLEVTR